MLVIAKYNFLTKYIMTVIKNLKHHAREDKAQRITPSYRPFPHRNPSKLFLDRIGFPLVSLAAVKRLPRRLVFLRRMIFSRVLRGSFVEERKCKNIGRRARVLFNAKQERIKRIYPLLMRNENSF